MNNYDNAEPKPLKFLVSDGKLVDESGNVIAESDSLQELYIKSSPQVKKYLLSDGSVVDENNNLIIKNDYYKKVYDQATPKVAKYLHSDGTIDENPGGGSGADLDDNKTATINVSTYTEPVEITPTAGKDGMKKATVTLSNIPSGGGAPSTEMPSWFDSQANSVVPSGVQIVGVRYMSSSYTIIITGDGESTISELLTNGEETFSFEGELVSYGESIVFAYEQNK